METSLRLISRLHRVCAPVIPASAPTLPKYAPSLPKYAPAIPDKAQVTHKQC